MVAGTAASAGVGRFAPLLAGVALSLVLAAPAAAQPRPPAAPAPGATARAAAAPDQLVVLKLVWSAMAALDHANRTGNYSVLRDLASPDFQANNSAATLAGIFQNVRDARLDLSTTLIVNPTYQFPPSLIDGGLLRVRGSFPLRPQPIAFDLLFQQVAGEWRIFGIAVAPGAQPQRGG